MVKKQVRKVRSSVIQEIRARITPSETRRVEDAMRIARTIETLMKERKLNNTRLIEALKAKGVEVQPSMVTRWLSGTHNFTQNTLSDIALGLGVEIEDLFKKKEECETVDIYMSVYIPAVAKDNDQHTTPRLANYNWLKNEKTATISEGVLTYFGKYVN